MDVRCICLLKRDLIVVGFFHVAHRTEKNSVSDCRISSQAKWALPSPGQRDLRHFAGEGKEEDGELQ